QTSFLANLRRKATSLEPITSCGSAAILPDDGVTNRFSRGALPNDRRLALIRNADGRDVGGDEAGFENRLRRDVGLRGPDFLGVVFHPAGFGKNLPELLLSAGDDGPV